MRRPAALLVALLLTAAIAAPAEAATVHRVFGARVGSAGVNGTVRITAFTSGYGRIDYALKSLRRNATYRVEVRNGRCANLGTVVARPASVTSSSAGTVVLGRGLAFSTSQAIWRANWSNLLAIRFVSGSSIRCGNLNFTRATRVRMPTQGVLGEAIDLAVVRAPKGYPYCNVAMYMGALNQPTEPGVTFLSAHARKRMFLPLLTQWQRNRGVRLIGKSVYVYTSNSQVHTYVIDRVRVAKSIQAAVGVTSERLWLQTSTGPNSTYPKLIIEAHRVQTAATTYAASHPAVRIVRCG